MKILKPGKVEMRKFVCPDCGCIFAANDAEKYFLRRLDGSGKWVVVDCVCGVATPWADAEPYEEPTQGKDFDRARLRELICAMPEFMTSSEEAEFLIDHGVSFREVT